MISLIVYLMKMIITLIVYLMHKLGFHADTALKVNTSFLFFCFLFCFLYFLYLYWIHSLYSLQTHEQCHPKMKDDSNNTQPLECWIDQLCIQVYLHAKAYLVDCKLQSAKIFNEFINGKLVCFRKDIKKTDSWNRYPTERQIGNFWKSR